MDDEKRDRDVLVIGASGFIGSAVHKALVDQGMSVRVLLRTPKKLAAAAQVVVGDLRDPVSVGRACEGVRTIVHAGSYVGSDSLLVHGTNVSGTATLVAAAQRSGVERLVYVSTASVYGQGIFRGLKENAVTPTPDSVVSQSRLQAEHFVLKAGGLVVRPHLIYGPGDRWFVPGLVRANHLLGGWPNKGQTLMSVIDVKTLGTLITRLTGPGISVRQQVYHAAHLDPVTLASFSEQLNRVTGLQLALGAMSCGEDQAKTVLLRAGFSPHQATMITNDHWYDCAAIWKTTAPTPRQENTIDQDTAQWYTQNRELLP